MPKRLDERNMDNELFVGCLTFGAISVSLFLVTLWPFLVFQDSYRSDVLGKALAYGLLPAFVFGAVSTRRLGVAGLGAFVAGIMTFGVFFFLRHHPFLAFVGAKDAPQLEYPGSFVWLVPVGSLLAAIFVVLIFPPKRD